MNVSLTPELETFVSKKVSSGMYQTASEVVREALRLLKERDEQKLRALRHDLQVASEQIERGEYTEYDERTLKDLFEKVRTEGLKRLAARKKRRR